MLEKVTVIDKVEVLEDGSVQVRRATYVTEDGVRITAPIYHRVAYEPGSDVRTEAGKVTAITAAVWTPEVVQAHEDRKAARAQAERG